MNKKLVMILLVVSGATLLLTGCSSVDISDKHGVALLNKHGLSKERHLFTCDDLAKAIPLLRANRKNLNSLNLRKAKECGVIS